MDTVLHIRLIPPRPCRAGLSCLTRFSPRFPMVYHAFAVNTVLEDSPAPGAAATDAALVTRACAGDESAFETLVYRHRNEVYALCYRFVRNREDAWDLAQDAFIKAYHALGRFRGDASFKTWVLRIAANNCKDFLKRRRLEVVPYDDAVQAVNAESGPTPMDTAHASELGRAIDQAVSALPEKHRLAFVLREYQGLSYQEMAGVMRCNLGTVMSRLFHARRKLQELLAPQGFMEG